MRATAGWVTQSTGWVLAKSGFTVTVSARTKANYHEVEQALLDAVDEDSHRIKNGARLFQQLAGSHHQSTESVAVTAPVVTPA